MSWRSLDLIMLAQATKSPSKTCPNLTSLGSLDQNSAIFRYFRHFRNWRGIIRMYQYRANHRSLLGW